MFYKKSTLAPYIVEYVNKLNAQDESILTYGITLSPDIDSTTPGEKISSKSKKYDYILIPFDQLTDYQEELKSLKPFCKNNTKLILIYFPRFWHSLVSILRRDKKEDFAQLNSKDVENILYLSDFEPLKFDHAKVSGGNTFGLKFLINFFVYLFPFLDRLFFQQICFARLQRPKDPIKAVSVSIIIPCKNERGNVERAIKEIPKLTDDQEIIFVEGNSKDDTYEECLRVQKKYKELDISVYRQEGKGKYDGVKKGFEKAKGELLMIQDGDLTAPPAELKKFYDAYIEGKGEFINGSRLIFPMEKKAMRFLNYLANHVFANLLSFIINQRVSDTLCGTKVITRTDYIKIMNRPDRAAKDDPYGDFDLIFGASLLNLKILDLPVHYLSRTYGAPGISRFREGLILLRLALKALKRQKICG